MALNTQQQLFVEHYLKLNNATQAAIAAGYSEKTAYSQGARLLKHAEVASQMRVRTGSAMQAAKAEADAVVETSARAVVTARMEADEVLTKLTTIARGDVKPFLASIGVNMPEEAPTHLIRRVKIKTRTVKDADGEPITETETELELHDPLSALNMLGKNLRLFDRAAEDDWRKQFEALGINADDFWEYAVQAAASRIEASTK
jgi:phage terminase small subunit